MWADQSVDYHSDRVLLPVEAQVMSRVERQTTLNVSVASILKITNSFDSNVFYAATVRYTLVNSDTMAEVASSGVYGSALSYMLQPGTNYQVNWTVVNWNADPVVDDGSAPWCVVTSLHMSLKPVAWGVSPTHNCAGQGSVFPHEPLIPASLAVPSSLKGTAFTVGAGQTFFVMQNANKQAVHEYEFTLDRISNLLVELRFDFAFLHLTARLTAKGNPPVYHTSSLSVQGSTLVVTGLRAGTFTLTIQDMSPTSNVALMGCRPWEFFFMVEEDVGTQLGRLGLIPFPDSFDDIGYLGYQRTASSRLVMHFARMYELSNVHVQSNNQFAATTNLTVQAASQLRVLMRLSDEEAHLVVPTLRITDLTDPSKSMANAVRGSPELLLDFVLDAQHRYQIGWSAASANASATGPVSWAPSRTLPVYVEVSIRDTSSMAAAISHNAAYGPTCTTSILPAITPDPVTGAYLWADDALKVGCVLASLSLFLTRKNRWRPRTQHAQAW